MLINVDKVYICQCKNMVKYSPDESHKLFIYIIMFKYLVLMNIYVHIVRVLPDCSYTLFNALYMLNFKFNKFLQNTGY